MTKTKQADFLLLVFKFKIKEPNKGVGEILSLKASINSLKI